MSTGRSSISSKMFNFRCSNKKCTNNKITDACGVYMGEIPVTEPVTTGSTRTTTSNGNKVPHVAQVALIVVASALLALVLLGTALYFILPPETWAQRTQDTDINRATTTTSSVTPQPTLTTTMLPFSGNNNNNNNNSEVLLGTSIHRPDAPRASQEIKESEFVLME